MIYLAHGASGNAASMKPYIAGLNSIGLAAQAVALSVRKAEEEVGAYRKQVAELPGAVIGGHSYGGRVASLLAAEEAPRGLILLSYPLHRPGHPEELRTAHWPRISCPVLLLSGESDQFARIELLRASVTLLPQAQLVTYPGVRHGLLSVRADVVERIAAFVATLP